MKKLVNNIIKELWEFCDQKFCENSCKAKYGKKVNDCYQSFFYKVPSTSTCCDKMMHEYCQDIIYHYYCRYYTRYISEPTYALQTQEILLKKYNKYNVVSIGCGAAPDLLSVMLFHEDNGLNQQINYTGIDLNSHWRPITDELTRLVTSYNVQTKFINQPFEEIDENIPCNILMLNYVLSHIIQHEYDLDKFFTQLYNTVIQNMPPNSIIIICDENNSNNHSIEIRDSIEYLRCFITCYRRKVSDNKYYFDKEQNYNRPFYGIKHPSNKILVNKNMISSYGFPINDQGYNIMGSCIGLQNIMVIS